MEYNDVFASIHWGTKNEKKELASVANQILRNAGGFEDVRKPATLLLQGLLREKASQSYDFGLSDMMAQLSDTSVAELRKDLNKQLRKAELEGSIEEFNQLSDYYHSFLVAGDRKANDIIHLLNDGLMKEYDRVPTEDHSDELFRAYFDKDDPRVPSYTVNFAELEGFDRFVNRFMCDSIVEKTYNVEPLPLDTMSPEALAKELFKNKPKGKDFIKALNEQIVAKDVDSLQLKHDVMFDVAIGVKNEARDKVILDAAMRRASRLLAKTMFYEEGTKITRSSENALHHLLKDLKSKPYANEPVDLNYKKQPFVEHFRVRKARKYLYDNFIEKPDLYRYARRILTSSMGEFNRGGITLARKYLQGIETNRIMHQDIRDACEYIDKYCLDSERLLTKAKTKEKMKPPKIVANDYVR